MKYEPLKDKKQQLKKDKKCTDNPEFNTGFEKGVDHSFDLFATFIELYKKYKDDVKLLMKEQNIVWSNWVKYYENHEKHQKAVLKIFICLRKNTLCSC